MKKIQEKLFEKTHLFKPFWKGTKGIYMCVSDFKKQERDILRELHCQMLSQQLLDKHLQIYWGFIQELQFVIIHSKREKSFCSYQKVYCNQEIGCLLNCEFPEHKGKGFLVCSEVVKWIFTKIVENLKWVAWELDVGTGNDRTSINQVCISLFPYLIYVIAINFVLHV